MEYFEKVARVAVLEAASRYTGQNKHVLTLHWLELQFGQRAKRCLQPERIVSILDSYAIFYGLSTKSLLVPLIANQITYVYLYSHAQE